MGLTSIFSRGPDAAKEVQAAGFEISTCSIECDSCSTKFPSNLSFDDPKTLIGSTLPYGMHIVVPTNKADWSHDALGEADTLPHSVGKWAEVSNIEGLDNSSKVKVTVSSQSSIELETESDYMDLKKGDLLILPFFVWVKGVHFSEAAQVLDAVIPDLLSFRDNELKTIPKNAYGEKSDVFIEADVNHSYIFMCSHKTRDKRCGITAPIMKREMEMHLRDLGLHRDASDDRPGGVRVAYVNHIGGHKYAANVIIYSKHTGNNIWLARCQPLNVIPIIDECIVNGGKVWPEKVRQVQKFKSIEW